MSVDNGLFTNSKLVHQKKQAEEESQVEWIVSPKKTERTTLSLSITKEDKIRLMKYTDETGVTAANVIHQLIQTLRKSDRE